MKSNFAIIVPAYNTEASIEQVLLQLSQYVSLKDVIVINDGSTDNTANIIRKTDAILLEHPHNKGKGAALKTAFQYILNSDYEAVITIDADLQHNPISIPNFIKVWQEDKADIIIGNRMDNITSMPLIRCLSNRISSFFVSWRAKAKILDSQSGYRLITRRVLEKIKLEYDGYMLETELLIKAGLEGFKFASVPIETIYGDETSHIQHFKITINFIKIILRSLRW